MSAFQPWSDTINLLAGAPVSRDKRLEAGADVPETDPKPRRLGLVLGTAFTLFSLVIGGMAG